MLALALPLAACAGSGHNYDNCDPDAGVCHGGFPGDGGSTTDSYLSPAVTVWHDGQHNSDGDVVAFNGTFYAAFRHAPSFAAAPSSVVIVRSTDSGQSWSKSAELNLDGSDLREPKLAVFGNALRVTATAWNWNDPIDHHTTVVAASSSDGNVFSALTDTGLNAGSEAWRPRPLLGSLWIAAWNADELYPADFAGNLSLFASSDGAIFSAPVPMPTGPGGVGLGGHQADMIQRADGSLWIAVPDRSEDSSPQAQSMCHTALSLPFSFTCWSSMQPPIGAPALFEFSGILFVTGEHDLPDGRARTAIWQVNEGNQSFDLIGDFPQSEGETGAPGVAAIDSSHALITYHSTSAQDPNVQALASEPTRLQAQSANYQVDELSVILDLNQIPAGL